MDRGMHVEAELSLRGGWLFRRAERSTLAQRLNADEQVLLEGELHDQLWEAPERLEAVAKVFPAIAAAKEARLASIEALNIGTLLRGRRWGLLFVELTGRCNERCVHCYAGSSPDVDQALGREQILGLVADAADLGFSAIQFTGGDPLLSPHLTDALHEARRRGIAHVEVYTNGLALRPALAAAIASCNAKMALSVYSHIPQVHDEITGSPGSLERTLSAIELARSLEIDVRVGVVLMEENLSHASEIRRLLAQRGVAPEKVGVDRERPVGRGHWHEAGSVPDGEWDSIGAHMRSESSIHSLSRQELGAGKLAVTYDGDVVPCIFDRRNKLGKIGERGGLRAVLETRVARQSSEKSSLPVLGEPLACSDCRARHSLLDQLGF